MGMDMSQYAEGESNYLKTEDIRGHEVPVTISRVELVELDKRDGGKQTKPVIFFQGKEKGMVCNITNVKRLTDGFGNDSDSWLGKGVILYTEDTELGPGLRVRIPAPVVADEEPIRF